MKIKASFIAIALAFCHFVTAQILGPTIGVSSLPADSDPICTINVYLDPDGTYETPGIQIGDTLLHFNFYDVNGVGTDILTELQKGKPLLLISGSYTCPVYRGKIPAINQIQATYGSQLSTFIIYVVEPHPDVDISPYSGNVWTTSANVSEGILHRQPTTYGERKTVVSTMLSAMTIDVPVLIDGPCNEYWINMAYAPNNAYLINTDGKVYVKHGWFHKAPKDMEADIANLLLNLGTDDLSGDKDKELLIYPNPSTGNFEMESPFPGESYNLQLLNYLGQEVFSNDVSNSNKIVKVNFSALDEGFYFLRYSSKNRVYTSKLIIER